MTPEQENLLRQINEGWDEIVADVAEYLRVDHIPVMTGWRVRDLGKYRDFLDGDAGHQAEFLASVPDDELAFYELLKAARQAYPGKGKPPSA